MEQIVSFPGSFEFSQAAILMGGCNHHAARSHAETDQVSAGIWMELCAVSSAVLRGLLFPSRDSPSERISTPTSPLLLLRLAPPLWECCLHGGAP